MTSFPVFFRRWVRLLFGREFQLQDLLVVWDALFADSITLNLVDYIFVAMLLYIRDACKYQLSYSLLKRMQTCFSKKKEGLGNAKFHCDFLSYWKSFQMLGEEPFIIRHGLLYLWNKLYLGVKCTFVFWVVLCFYMELQVLCAGSDTGLY